MHELEATEFFSKWLLSIVDERTSARIKLRIAKARSGNFGDCVAVGEGVVEMRLHFGPGYRLYYFQRGRCLYWLLAGGDKSTQVTDIEIAKSLKRKVERGEKC